jgi:hypothetical protein
MRGSANKGTELSIECLAQGHILVTQAKGSIAARRKTRNFRLLKRRGDLDAAGGLLC